MHDTVDVDNTMGATAVSEVELLRRFDSVDTSTEIVLTPLFISEIATHGGSRLSFFNFWSGHWGFLVAVGTGARTKRMMSCMPAVTLIKYLSTSHVRYLWFSPNAS